MHANKISLAIAIAAGLGLPGVAATTKAQALTAPAHYQDLMLRQLHKSIALDQTAGTGDISA
jgi:hypothetical protein